MSALPDNVTPFRYHAVNEEPTKYDSDEERRPTPGELGGGERHVRIPFAVFSSTLSPQAMVCYGWLQQHNGDKGCFPNFETLAEEMHCSIRAAKARVTELEIGGYVSHRRRGQGYSNRYDLHPNGDGPRHVVKPHRRTDVQKSASLDSEVQESARLDVQSSVNSRAENCTLIIPSNQTQLIKDPAPSERAAPRAEPVRAKAVETPKRPASTVEAKPDVKQVPRQRAGGKAAPSGDAFGMVGWLLKEQGGIARAEYLKVADAKAADAVIARLGDVEAAREHAAARLLEPRKRTLAWAHILEDLQRAEADRQRGVLERRGPRPMVGAVAGFGAVARRERGEGDDETGTDGRTARTTIDGVARPL